MIKKEKRKIKKFAQDGYRKNGYVREEKVKDHWNVIRSTLREEVKAGERGETGNNRR